MLDHVLPALLVCLAGPASAQTTWYVDASGSPPGSGTQSDPYTSIQYAIDQTTTMDSDVLLVASGTYTETVDLRGKQLLIDGSAAAVSPVIDAGGAGSAVTIRGGQGPATVLRGMRIVRGSGTPMAGGLHGGGVLIQGSSPTLEQVTIVGNSAHNGGGLAVLGGGRPHLSACVIEANEAAQGGGIYLDGSALTLTGSTLEGNRLAMGTPPRGGGVFARQGASFNAADTAFTANGGLGSRGGAVALEASRVTLRSCQFTGNRVGDWISAGWGGAVDVDPASQLTATDCLFTGNGAAVPGYEDGVFMGGAGIGGFYVRCEFRGNAAQLGGALAYAKSRNCVFVDNTACADGSGEGGAVYWGEHSCGHFEGNQACAHGGAAAWSSLHGCTLRGNRATFADPVFVPLGGGLYRGSATETLFEDNQAADAPTPFSSSGGGAHGALLLRCRLFGNRAQVGGGAGFDESHHASPGVRFSTLARNRASVGGGGGGGGGVWGPGTGVLIENSIVWGNLPDSVDGSPAAEVRYSCIEGGFAGTGNIALDPLFWGPVSGDLHLMAGSPCIDAGDPAAAPDPDGSPADMGALVFDPGYQGPPGVYCEAKLTAAHCLPAIGFLGSPTLSGPDDFQLTAADLPPAVLGLAVWSATPAETPFFGGILCLGPPVGRLGLQLSTGSETCGGQLSRALPQAELIALGLSPGDRMYLQWWMRDPAHPDGTGVALSDALEVTLLP